MSRYIVPRYIAISKRDDMYRFDEIWYRYFFLFFFIFYFFTFINKWRRNIHYTYTYVQGICNHYYNLELWCWHVNKGSVLETKLLSLDVYLEIAHHRDKQHHTTHLNEVISIGNLLYLFLIKCCYLWHKLLDLVWIQASYLFEKMQHLKWSTLDSLLTDNARIPPFTKNSATKKI